jgi:AcrR family transcriptional regulator
MSALAPERREDATTRYIRKRERILDVSAELINEFGVKGMTLVDVAQRVGLNTTSVTYYFKRKDLLAEAAFDRSLDRIEAIVLEAAKEPDPRARVSKYLELTLDRWARIRRREERPMARLSDLRAMDEPLRTRLRERYMSIFREARRQFFGPAATAEERALRTVRAAVLMENAFWLSAWLPEYAESDFPRVHRRLFELFDKGFAADGAKWRPRILAIDHEPAESDAGPETFLRAATRLVNELGYRGASVQRIASELNVTKGSFYHHLEAKDDLVLECFRRSYDRISRAQDAAAEGAGDAWDCLSSAIAALLRAQFGAFPLLRTVALQALPADVRHSVIERSNLKARRFAAMLIDGVTEGSVRAIDPLIASQVIMAGINTAYEMRNWAAPLPTDKAVACYASTLAYGFFADPRI